jgi:uncharacterized RDD family membrane protein YckC
MITQLINLAITLLVGWAVWEHYRTRTFSESEKYSTFGPRFWTGWVDSCVMWPLSFAVVLLNNASLPVAVMIALMVIQQSAWLFYTIGMHAKYGQTVGKMVCKVKVVDFATEGPISLRQAVLREGIPAVASLALLGYEIYLVAVSGRSLPIKDGNIVANGPFWGAAMIPLAWFLAEVLTMLSNEKRRALHDMIAGTVVIRTNVAPRTAVSAPLVEAT